MTLLVDVRHRLGAFELDAAFETSGRLVALFGPSGSGKTTLVNLIGGLMRPSEGKIAVDGSTLVDTAAGIFVPRHKRRIGYVFQDARLFPHMTVSQNLRYGRWFAPAGERYADFGHVVELLGIGQLLERRPSLLSGGEKQRVAIGRALLASPKLVLMDEPLASLDEARKAEIMPYIERLRDETKIPIVYVSHSVAEVARLATDIVVLAGGKVTASGSTSEILQRLDLLPEEERGEGGAVLDMEVAATRRGLRHVGAEIGRRRNPRYRFRCAHRCDSPRAHPGARRDDRDRAAARLERAEHPSRQGRRHRFWRRRACRRAYRLRRSDDRRAHHQAVIEHAWPDAWPGSVRRYQDGQFRSRQYDAQHRRRAMTPMCGSFCYSQTEITTKAVQVG